MSNQDRKEDSSSEAEVKRLQGLTGVPEAHALTILKGNDGDFRSALHTIWTMYHTCQSYTWATGSSSVGEGALKSGDDGGSSSALEDAIQVKLEVSNKEQVEREVRATLGLVEEVIRRFYVPERRAWKLLRTSNWRVEEVGTRVQLNKTYSLADHPQLRQVYMSFFGNPELSNMRCSNVAVSNAVDSYIADQCVEHVTFLMRDFGAGKTNEDHKGGGGGLGPGFFPAAFRFKPSRSGSKGHLVEIEDPQGHNNPTASTVSTAACTRAQFKEMVKVDCDLASAPPKFSLKASDQVYTFCVTPPPEFANRPNRTCAVCMDSAKDAGGFYVSAIGGRHNSMLCRACGILLAKNHDYELKFVASFDVTKKKAKKEAGSGENGEKDKEPTVPFRTGHRFLKMLTGMRSHHSVFLTELFRRLQLDEAEGETESGSDLLIPLQYGPDGSTTLVSQGEMEAGYGPPTTLLNTVVLKLPWVAAQEGGVFTDASFAFGHVIVDQTVVNDLNLDLGGGGFGVAVADTTKGTWGPNTTLVLSDWYGSVESTTLLDPSVAKTVSSSAIASVGMGPLGSVPTRPSSLQCVAVRQLPNPRHAITEVSDRLPDAAKAAVMAQMGGGGFGGPPTTGVATMSLLQVCRATHVTLIDLSALPFLEKLDVSTPVLLHPEAAVKRVGECFFAKGWSTNATLPAACGNMGNFLPKSQGSRLPTIFEQLPHLKVIPEGSWSDCQFDPPLLDLRSCLNSLTTIQAGAFKNCQSLVSVDLGIPTLTTIDNDVFTACPTLHNLSLANATNLTSIGRNFASGCQGLCTVLLPGCKRSPASSALTEMGSGFCCNCNQLSQVDFSGCTELGPQLGLWCIDTAAQLGRPSASTVRLRELDLRACTKLIELDHGSHLFHTDPRMAPSRRPPGAPADGEGTLGGGWCDANMQQNSGGFGSPSPAFESPSTSKKGRWEMYWEGQGTKVLLAVGVQAHLDKSFSGGASAAQKAETKKDPSEIKKDPYDGGGYHGSRGGWASSPEGW